VTDDHDSKRSLNKEKSNCSDEKDSPCCNCGVLEEQFPVMGKCYCKSDDIWGAVYNKHCAHCSIWSSLPNRTSLIVTYIFECPVFGYGKRIKE